MLFWTQLLTLVSRTLYGVVLTFPTLPFEVTNRKNTRKLSVLRKVHGRDACGLRSFLSLIAFISAGVNL